MVDAAAIRLGQGTPPAWGGAGEGSVFFDQADGQLYFRDAATGAIVGPLGAGGGGTFPIQFPQGAPPGFVPFGFTDLFAAFDGFLYAKAGLSTTGPLGKKIATGLVNYVAVDGNDTTADFYNIRLPYKTVQAALDDAIDGDVIVVGPGVFAGPALDLSALTDITIIGAGMGITVLDTNDGVNPLISAPATFARLSLANMSLHSKNTPSIFLNGAGGGGAFMASGCILQNIITVSDASAGLFLEYVGGLQIDNVIAVGGVLGFVLCNTPFGAPIRNLTHFGAQVRCDWDEANVDRPGGARVPMVFSALRSDTFALQIQNQPDVTFDAACDLPNAAIDCYGALTAVGGFAPNFRFYGRAQYADFNTVPIPDTATAQVWDFTGATFTGKSFGGVVLWVTIAGGAVNPVTVLATGIRVLDPVAGSNAVTFSTGANVTMDVRGASPPTCGIAGLGIIQPSQFAITIFLANGAGPQVIAWNGGITTLVPPKSIQMNAYNFGGGVSNVLNPAQFLPTTTGFTLYYNGVAIFGTDVLDVIAFY